MLVRSATGRLALAITAVLALASSTAPALAQGAPPDGHVSQASESPPPPPNASAIRRDARRSVRPELSAFSQYWGVSTDYPEESLVDVGREVEASAIDSGPIALGWGLGFGARYHYLDRLGIQARLILGLNQVYAGLSDQVITMASSVFELTPIVGPLGRFYAGPTVFAGAFLFDGRAFLYPEDASRDQLVPLLVVGAGGELGLHLGPREEVALLLKLLVGEVAKPHAPLGTNNSVGHLAFGASIAF